MRSATHPRASRSPRAMSCSHSPQLPTPNAGQESQARLSLTLPPSRQLAAARARWGPYPEVEESPSRAGDRPALLLPQAVRVTLSSARTARAAFLWVHDPPTRAARVPLPVYAAGRKLSLLARFGPHFLVARYQPSPVCAWHDVSPQFLTAPGLLTRAVQNPTC